MNYLSGISLILLLLSCAQRPAAQPQSDGAEILDNMNVIREIDTTRPQDPNLPQRKVKN
jgi:hypothetical protein